MKMHLNTTHSPARPCKFAHTIISAFCLLALFTSAVRAQTLTDGGNHDGTILLNQTNSLTFTATNGDRIVLRGAALTSTNTFNPWLRIYNPNDVLIADSGVNDGSQTVEELAVTAVNSTPAELTVYLKSQMEKWGTVIQDANGMTGVWGVRGCPQQCGRS